MTLFISIVLALAFGCLQFFLLYKGIRSVAKCQINVLYFIAQFFCPFVGLGLCVWLAKDWIILCAVIITSILILGSIGNYILINKKRKE